MHTNLSSVFEKTVICHLATGCAVVISFFLVGRGQYLSVLHLPQHECGVHQTRNPMGTSGCQAACLTAEDRFHLVVRVIMLGDVVTFHHMSLCLCVLLNTGTLLHYLSMSLFHTTNYSIVFSGIVRIT